MQTDRLLPQEELDQRSRYFTAVYTQVLQKQQAVLDAVVLGDTAAATAAFWEWVPPHSDDLPINQEMRNILIVRRMQGYMLLSLMLHQGYLLRLPVNKLYTVFENHSIGFTVMRTVKDFEQNGLHAIRAMCQLVNEQKLVDSHSRVYAAMLYVSDHIMEPLPEKSVADAVGLSVGHLNTLFKAQLQCTIYEYILGYKLENAAALLATDTRSISTIAMDFSFSSSSHFGKLFKEAFGMTPLQYRKQMRETRGTHTDAIRMFPEFPTVP